MVDRPRVIGLELPVYDPETLVVDAGNLDFERQDTRVVRSIHAYSNLAFSSLKSFLATADEELERAADMCKAEVVNHSWGLIQRYVGKSFVVDGDIMPLGYSLVAEVNVIAMPEITSSIPSDRRIRRGCKRYNRLKGLRHSDIHPRQFLYGVDLEEVRRDGQAKPKDWLVDIEPYVTYKR